MSSIYDQVWTIRGLVDVTSDIFLLPGDELQIAGMGTSSYRIIVNRGNKIWEECQDLVPGAGTVEPPIGIEDPANSVNLTDGGEYNAEVRAFTNNFDTQWQCLKGTLPTTNSAGQQEIADVTIWAPKMTNREQRILIIKAEHRDGGLQQNGTGHGDHR